MRHTSFLLLLPAAMAFLVGAGELSAQSPDLQTEDRGLVRVARHPDGSRSIYKRQPNKPGIRRVTYIDDKLAAIYDYLEGDKRIVGCTVSDPKRTPLYKVAYIIDERGNINEELVHDFASGRLIQRVVYRYDPQGRCAGALIYDEASQPLAPSKALPPTYDRNALRMMENDRPIPPSSKPSPTLR